MGRFQIGTVSEKPVIGCLLNTDRAEGEVMQISPTNTAAGQIT